MKIQWQTLSESALTGLIQEFVTREGTEYGAQEVPVSTKVEQVLAQLQSGRVEIVYDEETLTTSISTIDGS
ncbi:MAG: YheU family protein [Proteobacteria bacterium]|nr:YheU family protein [Pseudomonadota bacterium]MCH8257140.1 YheU family protein [Pseudomonadota bacterium]